MDKKLTPEIIRDCAPLAEHEARHLQHDAVRLQLAPIGLPAGERPQPQGLRRAPRRPSARLRVRRTLRHNCGR